METQNSQLSPPIHIEQKIWQHELEQMAEENDFLLNLLVSIQKEHLICTKHEEKATIFFNYFQYFSHLIKHLKELLLTMNKEGKDHTIYSNFKEEMENLGKKHQIFKINLKSFFSDINNHKMHETKVHH